MFDSNNPVEIDITTILLNQCLPCFQVDSLYDVYSVDFELFDYGYEAYREMASPGQRGLKRAQGLGH